MTCRLTHSNPKGAHVSKEKMTIPIQYFKGTTFRIQKEKIHINLPHFVYNMVEMKWVDTNFYNRDIDMI